MKYNIEAIELFRREMPAPSIEFSLGNIGSLFPELTRFQYVTRLTLRDSNGKTAHGFCAEWPMVQWLDKRSNLSVEQKLDELFSLITHCLETAIDQTAPSVFDIWLQTYEKMQILEPTANSIGLYRSFAASFIERSILDAFCRLRQTTFFDALKNNLFGLRLDTIHQQLHSLEPDSLLLDQPARSIQVRHTVGLNDEIFDHDREQMALEQLINASRLRYLKIKLAGDMDRDLYRLGELYRLIENRPILITLDGNEAFAEIDLLSTFLRQLKSKYPELWRQILLIEQPLARYASFTDELRKLIDADSSLPPFIIDEADDNLHSFWDATQVGYLGVSHKSCKGIFKSIANLGLCKLLNLNSESNKYFLSAEDLTTVPVTALHQDLAVVNALNIPHVERNGHHFFRGFHHLTSKEISELRKHHHGLYEQTPTGFDLRIRKGSIDTNSINEYGFGGSFIPDCTKMVPVYRCGTG